MTENNIPSKEELARYIDNSHSLPISFEDIKSIIELHFDSIQNKKDILISNLNSLIQKMNKDPLLLIDGVYGVRKFDNVKRHL